ncbi:hypothetical protein GEMRC1_010957 [Eukaryota sp. GEM-RC1]
MFPSRLPKCSLDVDISYEVDSVLLNFSNILNIHPGSNDFTVFNQSYTLFDFETSSVSFCIHSAFLKSCNDTVCSISFEGSNLGHNASLLNAYVGDFSCVNPRFSVAHFEFFCDILYGTGESLITTVSLAGETKIFSNISISFPPPMISEVNPLLIPMERSIMISISGNYFGQLSESISVYFNQKVVESNLVVNETFITTFNSLGCGVASVYVVVSSQKSNEFFVTYEPPDSQLKSSASFDVFSTDFLQIKIANFPLNPELTDLCQFELLTDSFDCLNQTSSLSQSGLTISCLPFGITGSDHSLSLSLNNTVFPSNILLSANSPLISSISNTTLPLFTTTSLEISGNNFGDNGDEVLVCLEGQCDHPISVSNFKIVVDLPVLCGADLILKVSVNNLFSNEVLFSFLPPSINSVNFDRFLFNEENHLSINGLHFGSSDFDSTFVIIDDVYFEPTMFSNSFIYVISQPFALNCSQLHHVRVQVCDQTSAPVSFSPTKPEIFEISPLFLPVAIEAEVSIKGRYFGTESKSIQLLSSSVFAIFNVSNCVLLSSTSIKCIVLGYGYGDVMLSRCSIKSDPFSISFEKPIVQHVSPNRLLPFHSSSVRIVGKGFGLYQSLVNVTLTTDGIQHIVIPYYVSHTEVEFLCPLLRGNSTWIVGVTVADLQSETFGLLKVLDSSLYYYGVLAGATSGTTFSELSSWQGFNISFLSSGTSFGLLLSESNVYSFGESGSAFSLGLGSSIASTLEPIVVDFPSFEDVKVTHVFSNFHSSIVLTDNGSTFGFGDNLGFCLPSNDTFLLILHCFPFPMSPLCGDIFGQKKSFDPRIYPELEGATAVAAGQSTAFAISNHDLYVWGQGSRHKLGRNGNVDDLDSPTKIPNFKFLSVSCKVSHCLLIDLDYRLLCFGHNFYGECGVSTQSDVILPTFVWDSVAYVATAYQLSSFVDFSGSLYICGRTSRYQGKSDHYELAPLKMPFYSAISKVVLGRHFCIAYSGDLYTNISNVHPHFLSTKSPELIIIDGLNLGLYETVPLIFVHRFGYVNEVFSNSTNMISFSPPSLTGSLDFELIFSTFTIKSPFTVYFNPPVLLNLIPSEIPTVGGSGTLVGVEFGDFIDVISVTVCGFPATVMAVINHSVIEFEFPPIVGDSISLIVDVDGQSVDWEGELFSSPPEIFDVFPFMLHPFDLENIEIFGNNFGSLSAGCFESISVNISGLPCIIQSFNHSLITCRSTRGWGSDLSLSVCVNSRCDTFNKMMAYDTLQNLVSIKFDSTKGPVITQDFPFVYSSDLVLFGTFDDSFFFYFHNATVFTCRDDDCVFFVTTCRFVSTDGLCILFDFSVVNIFENSPVQFENVNSPPIVILSGHGNLNFLILDNSNILICSDFVCRDPYLSVLENFSIFTIFNFSTAIGLQSNISDFFIFSLTFDSKLGIISFDSQSLTYKVTIDDTQSTSFTTFNDQLIKISNSQIFSTPLTSSIVFDWTLLHLPFPSDPLFCSSNEALFLVTVFQKTYIILWLLLI